MQAEQTIVLINSLIEINNDRIEGYQTASKETSDADLKIVFAQFIHTSQKCKAQLIREVQKLSGTPIYGTNSVGKVYRVWMDFKALVTRGSRVAILNSCEQGEQIAVNTYQLALENNNYELFPALQTLIYAQYELIKAEYDEVKVLRDMLLEQNA